MESNINSTAERKPTVFAASMLYLIVLVLMMALSYFSNRFELQGNNYFFVLFIVQVVSILLPPLIYLMIKRIKIRPAVRLNKISLGEVFLTIGITVFGYGVIVPINLVWNYLLSKIGTPQSGVLPEMHSPGQYLLALLVIAVTPAIVEEFLFRGVMMRGYEKYGTRISIVLTGVLFALLHLSILSLPSILLMGILLSYIVYRTNSLLTGIIYHFINNAIAVTIMYLASILEKFIPITDEAIEGIESIPDEQMKFVIIVWSVLGLIALGLFSGCLTGFILVTKKKHKSTKAANIEAQEDMISDSDTEHVSADNDEAIIKAQTEESVASAPVRKRNKFVEFIPALIAILIIVGMLVLEVLKMANLA